MNLRIDTHLIAGINLNPYQGLKPTALCCTYKTIDAGINLNPYQGLKRNFNQGLTTAVLAGINLNPYQGLKPIINNSSGCRRVAPEST